MHAYRTILTHFSQRYTSVPVVSNAPNGSTSLVAFDFMRVSFADLHWAYRLMPAFEAAFPPSQDGELEDIE